ncbi:hypothetical protein NIES2100_61510 [Calothrix sp. NIES-2100]|nr:hypothetical protein NIES2100_61510 [Calothrix sp. NIES-2100]
MSLLAVVKFSVKSKFEQFTRLFLFYPSCRNNLFKIYRVIEDTATTFVATFLGVKNLL